MTRAKNDTLISSFIQGFFLCLSREKNRYFLDNVPDVWGGRFIA